MKRLFPLFTLSCTMMVIIALVWATIACAADEPLLINADSQYRYAQSLYDSGAFNEAINEFGRFIHFFPTDSRIPKATYLVGMAYFNAGQYPDATRIFWDISANEHWTNLRSDAFFMLSRSHARQGMIQQAMVDLHNLIAISPQTNVIDRARYEMGWLHVDLGQWQPAKQSFNQITSHHQAHYHVGKLNTALSGHDRIPTRHPLTAGLFSIIPGAGQLYCGRYQDALAAFLINTGLILSAWEAFDNDLYALGGVISFVEFGFYSGNIYGAISSAHKFNRGQADAFREDLYRLKQPSLSISAAASGIILCLAIDF
jgi:outer membrane protein assembly factor BamD (BamD/ComL family)